MQKNTFMAAPLRIPNGLSGQVRTAVSKIESACNTEGYTPTNAERTAFWDTLATWCHQNTSAIEGATTSSGGATG